MIKHSTSEETWSITQSGDTITVRVTEDGLRACSPQVLVAVGRLVTDALNKRKAELEQVT